MFQNQIVQFGSHSDDNICLLESNDLFLKQSKMFQDISNGQAILYRLYSPTH